jgi:hypothetical protein
MWRTRACCAWCVAAACGDNLRAVGGAAARAAAPADAPLDLPAPMFTVSQASTMGSMMTSEKHRGKALGKPTDAELDAYKQFAAFHNVQETLFWTRNNILVVLQAGLLAASFSILAKDTGGADLLIGLLGGVGFLLAIVWIGMVLRSEYVFRQTLHILSTMERVLPLRPEFRVFWRFRENAKTSREDPEPVSDNEEILRRLGDPKDGRSRLRLSTLWWFVGFVFAAVWLVLVLQSFLPFWRSAVPLD